MMDDFMTAYMLKNVPFDFASLHSLFKLAEDEMIELKDELKIFAGGNTIDNRPNIVKESIDVIYVLSQRLRRMGVDVDAALAEVHRSNMSKALPLDGSVKLSDELEVARKRYPQAGIKEGQRKAVLICGETNKVIKPTTYSPAVITQQIIQGI